MIIIIQMIQLSNHPIILIQSSSSIFSEMKNSPSIHPFVRRCGIRGPHQDLGSHFVRAPEVHHLRWHPGHGVGPRVRGAGEPLQLRGEKAKCWGNSLVVLGATRVVYNCNTVSIHIIWYMYVYLYIFIHYTHVYIVVPTRPLPSWVSKLYPSISVIPSRQAQFPLHQAGEERPGSAASSASGKQKKMPGGKRLGGCLKFWEVFFGEI